MKTMGEKEIAAQLFQAAFIQQLQALGIGSREVSFTDTETANRVLKIILQRKNETCIRASVSQDDPLLITAYPQLLKEAGVEEVYLVNKTSAQTGLLKISLENVFLDLPSLFSICENALTLVSLDGENLIGLEVYTDCDTKDKVEIKVFGQVWGGVLKEG